MKPTDFIFTLVTIHWCYHGNTSEAKLLKLETNKHKSKEEKLILICICFSCKEHTSAQHGLKQNKPAERVNQQTEEVARTKSENLVDDEREWRCPETAEFRSNFAIASNAC